MDKWTDYLDYLDRSTFSVKTLITDLSPQGTVSTPKRFVINRLGYEVWPFQRQILLDMGGATLILGLPTGLGKTYLAGARLAELSQKRPIRVLFLVPSVPLGVQQVLFARQRLGVEAFFVSGGISPERRRSLAVWNNSFVVATPQTFYNDYLAQYGKELQKAKGEPDPESYLFTVIEDFPFDIVVADECQRYVGQTDGYSILLAARACGVQILALSATPQLHAPQRLLELMKIFDRIKTFSIDAPGIREHMPERLLSIETIRPPTKLLGVYSALSELTSDYTMRIRKLYGPSHPLFCSRHQLCRALLATRMLRNRVMEDGASSVEQYGTWEFRDLCVKRRGLDGKSIHDLYLDALKEQRNHKLEAVIHVLSQETFNKAIVYVESVEAAKELGLQLQARYGIDEAACLVGKGDMSMDQQASALLQFREKAKTLTCTSVGEEGLDIPSADLEVWVDPPSNPRKWIQRFGRILRQPGDKKVAKTIALINAGTHENARLMSVMRKVESIYRFTQRVEHRTR